MSILVTGSVAVDTIMVFHGRFVDHILPDKIHALNVAFHVPELRRTYGGCAANIAYNLKLLGEDPILRATVGGDFGAYAAWLDENGIRRDWLLELSDETTAGAFITTDEDDNQIIGFHPGAMDRAHEAPVSGIDAPFDWAIVSPNGKQAMVEHAQVLKERGVSTVIDPGQGLPLFGRDDLIELLEGADVYIVNDYEWSLTLDTSKLSEDEIAGRVKTLIVTRGAEGSRVRQGGDVTQVAPVPCAAIVDPTGCGDAYRAGLLFGLAKGHPLETCTRIASLMGSLEVEHPGTQSLRIDAESFRVRYEREFGTGF